MMTIEPDKRADSMWLQRLSPRPAASVRLFAFHHAGGSAAAFRHWPGRMPDFDVCAVQLPGRMNRIGDPLLTRIEDIVDALLPELVPLLDRPFAFFGHSMGSAVAYAVAAGLHARGLRLPAHLFVSGRQPPHKPFPEQTLAGMSDARVVHEIERHYGGFPPEVQAHPELLELVLPALRADFAVLEADNPHLEAPLPVHITAIGGASDPCAALDHLLPWQHYTTFPLRMLHFPGAHFYLDAALGDIADTLRGSLKAEMTAAAFKGKAA